MLSRRDIRGISRCCSSSKRPADRLITYSIMRMFVIRKLHNLVHSRTRIKVRKKDEKIESCVYDKFSRPNFD